MPDIKPVKRRRRIPPKDGAGCIEVTPENALKLIIGVETEDWRLERTMVGEFEGTQVSHFYLVYIGKKNVCPQCGQTMVLHDYKERVWRHANLDKTVCYIHANIPRYKCSDCGTVRQVDIPWADPNVSYSKRFSEVAIELMSKMSLRSVSDFLLCSWTVLDDIVGRVVDDYLDNMDLSNVRKIRIDETSAKKNHRYITIVTDAETNDIIFITKGKDSAVLEEFADWLRSHNGDPDAIDLIASDFGEAFICGARKYLPNAENVYDLFHLIQLGNQKLDKDRSANQVNGQRLKRIRYAILKNPENLTKEEHELVMDIRMDNKVIGRSYEMNMSLRDAFSMKESWMTRDHLKRWVKWVKAAGTSNFRSLAKTVEKHLDGIIRAIDTGINNGFQEGLNSRVQLSKRLANGYHKELRLGRIVIFRHRTNKILDT